jgi:hypothetical protein
MKKALAAVVLILLAGMPAFAGGFKFFFGPAITNVSLSEDYDPFEKKSLLQFTGGAGFSLDFTPNIGLEVDVLYAPGGAKWEYDVPSFGMVTGTLKGYGISLPVLLKVSFMQGTTPYILAGGSLAYAMAAKLELKYPGGSDDEDFLEDTNRLQYAAQFGGGVEFVFAGMTFFIEGRYVLGLSNLIKDPDPGDSAKYNNIFFFGGISF